jgi:predicted TIM-barrel fold metal-dependent hydrolase
MSIFDEPKIDCHNHVFDPARFEFSPKAHYLPASAELGTRAQLSAVFAAYGVQRALVIQPNSGYDDDNRCLIDVLARGEGRFKGMAVVGNDVSRRELERLRALRIDGVTLNAALLGVEYYSNAATLLIRAFGPDACVWGSDWPFLRAPERIDYGPLLTLIEHLVPERADRSKLLWHTPNRLFGFAAPPPPPPSPPSPRHGPGGA